jgi:uncharacterized repeat protein (TIGR03847 family)
MPEPTNEFSSVTEVRPEAIGEPGQRTFRVLVDSGSSSAEVWLEKEQLLHLALAIQQLLAAIPEHRDALGEAPTQREAPGLTHLDFKVGKLALGHDSGSGLFMIDSHDIESEDEDPATVRFWLSRPQARAFAEESLRVCAAGRPICPLCGGPIDPTGHICPRVNGHGQRTEIRDL